MHKAKKQITKWHAVNYIKDILCQTNFEKFRLHVDGISHQGNLLVKKTQRNTRNTKKHHYQLPYALVPLQPLRTASLHTRLTGQPSFRPLCLWHVTGAPEAQCQL